MNNLFQLMGMLTQDPKKMLSQYGLNIPQNIRGPQDIIQYLLNTGQIDQGVVNSAMQMRNNPMFKNLY